MHIALITKIVGLFLVLFSIVMLVPVGISIFYSDKALNAFLLSFVWTMSVGLALYGIFRKQEIVLRTRDGFLIVVLFWTVLGFFGSMPFMLSPDLNITFTDAVFESISGLTTTGATVLTGIDHLPQSILFYRQFLQWLGGMGIIVLAVAVLPMLGVGGMQLYRAETPGPIKDTKITPRIAETAKALWYIYLGLTVLCALAFKFAGMSTFDAVSHAFSTIAIGGFSTHDKSIGFFDSTLIELITVFFMFLAGINFALHFFAWRARNPKVYFFDTEVRAYTMLLLISAVVTVAYLYLSGHFPKFEDALTYGIFQTVSIGTTTGFTTAVYSEWPSFLPVLLLFISFIGGCAGSTGGGLKVIRFVILLKQGLREIKRLIHPNAEVPIKIGNKAMSSRVLEAVWGFFAAYVASFSIIMLALMSTGMDQTTAFSAVAACINNLGPGMGIVAEHYKDIGDTAKWLLSFAMLLGRLEVFTLLVLISPVFWRR